MIYVTIETESGIYTVKKPMGRLGAIHFGILAKYIPSNKKRDDDTPLSPLEQERLGQAFDEWSQKVLPNIIVSFKEKDSPEAKPITIDDMAGEDQFAIFGALSTLITVSDNFFRVISK